MNQLYKNNNALKCDDVDMYLNLHDRKTEIVNIVACSYKQEIATGPIKPMIRSKKLTV